MQNHHKTKIQKNLLTTLDPLKHSIISFATSTDERANISLTTRSNPLFIPPANNGRVSGTNPLSDPPDTGEHDLGNISDEYDDSDYTADSVEEEDVSLDSTGSLVEEEEMCVEQQVESPTQ
ncbi:hypothetical protein WN943_019123 [Citrus x changshan-huyou]